MSIDNDIRKSRVGASEASALCGLHPHMSAIDVYNRLVLGEQKEQTDIMAIGAALEPAVVELYARKTGANEIATATTQTAERYPHLCATPDRIVRVDGDSRLLEVKTHSYFGAADEWGEPGTDETPEAHKMQVQLTLAVTGLPRADLAVLFSGRDFRIYSIRANAEYQREAYEVVHEFYQAHVKPRVPPPPDGHENYTEFLKRTFPLALNADVLAATEQDERYVREYLEAKAKSEEFEQQYLTAKQYLQLRIGDASGLRGAFGSISYRNVKSKAKTDWRGVAMELGASETLVKKYTTEEMGYRRFLVTAKGLVRAA